MRIPLIALFFTLFSFAAQAETWKMDNTHSAVTFEASHLGFSITQGWFRKFESEINFDPDSVETSSVNFTIDATSIDTNMPARDDHLRGRDFLDVKNHPELTFRSTKVRITGAETAEITGDFTMRGETHEEVFSATLRRIGPSPFNSKVEIAGFTITGEIERTKYGVKFGAPAIGGVIPIRVDMEIFKKK
ncbi:MAG: YceI family protein [Pikeienuella sp.]